MKNRHKKNGYYSKLKSSVFMSFRLFLYIVCFTFLSFRLTSSLTGVAYANSVAGSSLKLSQSSVFTLIDPNNVAALELLRADSSSAYSQKDTNGKDQLRKLIEQIRSVEFEPQKPVPKPAIVPEKSPAVEPNETVINVPAPKEDKQKPEQTIELKQQHRLISEKTLQALRTLANNPGKINNPLELGEVLFISGNLNEAAIFYSEALKRKDPNDTGGSQDRAWILFQMGNCLYNDDKPTAAKMYRQLLTEYPNSPWAPLATARSNLIAWYLKDGPLELIQQVEQAGSEQHNRGQDKHE